MGSEIETNDLITYATNLFIKTFNSKPVSCGCAPGRVNLIGEHTDYNDGYVLPMALPFVTVVVGKRNNTTNNCHIITSCPFVDEPYEVKFCIPSKENNSKLLPGKPVWANYVKGVIANFIGELEGFEAAIATNVPVGGGLSSSAALEVATYCFLETVSSTSETIPILDKVLACQKAEHDFLEMPCGIMDQFISFNGQKDHALLLDCRSYEYELLPLKDQEVTILITNTNVRHKLADSQYPKRKEQCETAAKIIGKSSLRDISLSELESHKDELDEVIYKRALHVIEEIHRTKIAADALIKEDYTEFGRLMTQSHESLRDNYEVSCLELDTVVKAALEIEGVYGSRMTGGGFGGCVVTMLRTEAVSKTMQNIQKIFENPTFYVCRPGEGAKAIQLPI